MAKTVPWWSLIPTALFAGVAVWAIGPRVENPSGQHVTLEFPGGGKLDVSTEREGLDHETLMKQLFAKDFSRNGVLGWLKDNQRLYGLESPEMAQALNTMLCDPIPLDPLDQRLAKAKECASKPVAIALRRLSSDRAVPFHYVGNHVLVGVQKNSRYRPGPGHANVCRTGPYVAQKLQVIDVVTNRVVEVEAGGVYECTVGKFPELQLDPEDAVKLFGRPTNEFEKVIVVII